MLIWAVSVLFFMKVFLKQEKQELPVEELMGIAHDVFQLEKEAESDNILTSSDLSEEDFEVEYDSIIMDNILVDDDNDNGNNDNVYQDEIAGFEEIRQMVAIVGNDAPLSAIAINDLKDVKRTIRQIEETELFEKMIKTKADISRRLDDILNNVNF
jgi:hypothetical protein